MRDRRLVLLTSIMFEQNPIKKWWKKLLYFVRYRKPLFISSKSLNKQVVRDYEIDQKYDPSYNPEYIDKDLL